MYTSFEIQNFRGFKDFKLEKLARINLIAGQNNVGKTALLEALYLHSRGDNTYSLENLLNFRGLVTESRDREFIIFPDALSSVFYDFDFVNEIRLTGVTNHKRLVVRVRQVLDQDDALEMLGKTSTSEEAVILGIASGAGDDDDDESYAYLDHREYIAQGGIQSSLVSYIYARNYEISQLAKQFSRLVLDNQRERLVSALQVIDPALSGLELLAFNNETMLWAANGSAQPKPLITLGDGVNTLMRIVCAMGTTRGGIILIDEIENGLHYSIQKDVWKAIHKAAVDFNVQVFATTHSRECILAAHDAFTELGAYDDFQYIRLEKRKDGRILAIPYDQGSTEAAFEMNLEVR
jgi:predicted ATPase